ncbi:MAG: SapC family protein [Pseudomonadota bacterium]
MDRLSKTYSKEKNLSKVQAAKGVAIAERFGRAKLLDRELHKDIKLNREAGFEFARLEIAVPLIVNEFSIAARDVPIVFSAGDGIPLAVLGIRPDQNLFVDADGHWKAGCYIPAHLRRYPFILHEDEVNKRFSLCIDESAEHFKEDKAHDNGEPLFVEEKPAPFVTEMLGFLGDMQQGLQMTQDYIGALKKENLLIEQNAQIELRNGEKPRLDGFFIIDEAKFNTLPETVLKEWQTKGWLAFTYFHLQSQLNWQRLIDMSL